MNWFTKGPGLVIAVALLALGGWFLFLRDTTGTADTSAATEPTTVTTPNSDPLPKFGTTTPTPGFRQVPRLPAPVTASTDECDPIETGWNYRERNWGRIRLPYGDTWPTNEPGQPPTCFPQLTHDTPTNQWMAAIAAAHIVWIDRCSPNLINQIASPTASRQARIDDHPGPCDPQQIPGQCQTLSWTYDDRDDIALITTQCGTTEAKVTAVPMEYDPAKGWYAVYPINGKFEVASLTERELDEIMFAFAPNEG